MEKAAREIPRRLTEAKIGIYRTKIALVAKYRRKALAPGPKFHVPRCLNSTIYVGTKGHGSPRMPTEAKIWVNSDGGFNSIKLSGGNFGGPAGFRLKLGESESWAQSILIAPLSHRLERRSYEPYVTCSTPEGRILAICISPQLRKYYAPKAPGDDVEFRHHGAWGVPESPIQSSRGDF